jgi:hypothetical protein
MSRMTRVFARSRLYLFTLSICSAMWAQPAAAVLASFDIPPMATQGIGDAVVNGTNIELTGNLPGFRINFTLPRNYVNNTEVLIVIYFTAGASPCQIRFEATELTRKRPGATTVTDLSGLSGNTTFNINLSTVVQKNFKLNPGGPLAGQIKGDSFGIEFKRQSAHVDDTCISTAFVESIEIRYTVQP